MKTLPNPSALLLSICLGGAGSATGYPISPVPLWKLVEQSIDDPSCDGLVVCSRIDLPALPGIWREARRELGIPDVAPATVPPRVLGVGGDTPD